jgi:hypothetical protein
MNQEDKMGYESLVAIVKPIVESIDRGVEVCITQSPAQRAGVVYEVHISKRGVTASFEAPVECIARGGAQHEQLRAGAENALEDIRSATELTVRGTVAKLAPVLCRFAVEERLSPVVSSDRPSFAPDDWEFSSYWITTSEPHSVSRALGRVEIQGLPDEFALLTFDARVGGESLQEGAPQTFWAFCGRFVNRLVQLGFIERPMPTKRPIGFQTR